MGDKDFERVDDLGQRDRAVGLPFLDVFFGLDKDDKVLVGTFVVDLGHCVFASRHPDGSLVWEN